MSAPGKSTCEEGAEAPWRARAEREHGIAGPEVSSRPRVLFFLVRTDRQIYGGTQSILLFLEHQRSVDAVVVCASPFADDPALEEMRRLGIRCDWVPLSSGLYDTGVNALIRRARRATECLVANMRAARLIRRYRPDIVHVDFEGVFFAGPAAKIMSRPLVQHIRGVQPGHRIRWTLRAAMRIADVNVAIAPSLRQFLLAGVPPRARRRLRRRLEVVYNGFPLERLERYMNAVTREEARCALGITAAEIMVGVVGGIFPMKGQVEFLRDVVPAVVRAHPQVRFFMVGGVKNEAYAAKCRAIVHEQGLEKSVVFTGYSDRVFDWFRAMDILAFPSLQEGFGRVAVEAQAFGVPVVAYDIVGVRDALAHGVGGILVADAEEFSRALQQLVGDAALRERMGASGRDYVRRFDVNAVTERLEIIYAELNA